LCLNVPSLDAVAISHAKGSPESAQIHFTLEVENLIFPILVIKVPIFVQLVLNIDGLIKCNSNTLQGITIPKGRLLA